MIEFTRFEATEHTQCPVDPTLWVTYRTRRNDPDLKQNNPHFPVQAGKVNWDSKRSGVVIEYAVVHEPKMPFMNPLFSPKEQAYVLDIQARIKAMNKKDLA